MSGRRPLLGSQTFKDAENLLLPPGLEAEAVCIPETLRLLWVGGSVVSGTVVACNLVMEEELPPTHSTSSRVCIY